MYSSLVDAVVSLPLLDVKVRILRTFGQALVVTRLGSHFSAYEGSELHKCKVSCFFFCSFFFVKHVLNCSEDRAIVPWIR